MFIYFLQRNKFYLNYLATVLFKEMIKLHFKNM